jgi:hypothetical protein
VGRALVQVLCKLLGAIFFGGRGDTRARATENIFQPLVLPTLFAPCLVDYLETEIQNTIVARSALASGASRSTCTDRCRAQSATRFLCKRVAASRRRPPPAAEVDLNEARRKPSESRLALRGSITIPNYFGSSLHDELIADLYLLLQNLPFRRRGIIENT